MTTTTPARTNRQSWYPPVGLAEYAPELADRIAVLDAARDEYEQILETIAGFGTDLQRAEAEDRAELAAAHRAGTTADPDRARRVRAAHAHATERRRDARQAHNSALWQLIQQAKFIAQQPLLARAEALDEQAAQLRSRLAQVAADRARLGRVLTFLADPEADHRHGALG